MAQWGYIRIIIVKFYCVLVMPYVMASEISIIIGVGNGLVPVQHQAIT